MEMGLNLRSMDEENSAWISWKSAPGAGFSWEEQAFAEDAGSTWPPRSYSCNFCRKEFRSAQALGGHMNIHRRDRARLRQALSLEPSSQHNQSGFLAEAQKQPVLSSFYSFSDPQASAMNISNGLSRQSFNWVPLISASDPPPNLHHPGNGLPASGQQSGVVSATSRSFSSSVVTAPSTVLSISLYSSPSVVGHVTEPEIFAATESSGSSELLESSRSEKRMDLQVGRLRSRRTRNNNNSNLRELARVEEVEPYLDLELRLGDRPLQQHQIDSRSHGEF